MENLEQYKNQGEMSEQALDEVTRAFLQAKLDREKKAAWVNRLAEKHQIHRTPTAKVRSIPFRVIAIAASILLAIALIPILGLFSNSAEALLAEYTIENPYPNRTIRKSTEADLSEIRLNATEAYNQQQFAAAIENYQQLVQQDQAQLEDLLYLGLSQIYEQESQNAVETLEKAQVLSVQTQSFEQEIDWFLALAYLQNEAVADAKQLLDKIVNTNAWRAADAQKLLDAY